MQQNKRQYKFNKESETCPKCNKQFKRLLSHQTKDPNCDQEKPKIKFNYKVYGMEYFTQKKKESKQRKMLLKLQEIIEKKTIAALSE